MNLHHALNSYLAKRTRCLSLLALILTTISVVGHAAALPALTAVSGSYQYAPYGSVFAKPLVVQVTDPSTKAGIAGVQVNFTPAAGIQLSTTSATTDASGLATVNVMGTAVGTSSVVARTSVNPSAAASFINLIITKAALTVLPGNVESIAGTIPRLQYYSLVGFMNGEDATSAHVTGVPALSTTATSSSRAGVFNIVGQAGSLTSPNYSFVQGVGKLTLDDVPVCGNLGIDTSSQLSGTYAFNLYNQQAGYTGILTADGTSRITGQSMFNSYGDTKPSQWTITGNYRIGNGYRGGAALLHTSAVNATQTRVNIVCFAMENVVNGVAQSGRILMNSGYQFSQAGSFYRFDGTATTAASLSGTYIASLQGSRKDTGTGDPLQYAQVASLHLDGNGHVMGSLFDVDYLNPNGSAPTEQYQEKQQVTGTYTFNTGNGTGSITLNGGGTVTTLQFVAPSSQRLFLLSADNAVSANGSSAAPVYIGSAQKQSAGPFSAASLSGDVSYLAQGVDAYSSSYAPQYQSVSPMPSLVQVRSAQTNAATPGNVTASEDLVSILGGKKFDGAGTMSDQGQFTFVDGNNTAINFSSATVTYTVDPATGRFESRDPSTNMCTLCGYLVGPNTLVALAPGSGVPLIATLTTSATRPVNLNLTNLVGRYAVGTESLISPVAQAFQGILTFDGKGNFQGATDTYSQYYGAISNMKVSGTYAVQNGAFALTLTGNSTPDFYLYLNTNGTGMMVPYSPTQTANVPLMSIHPSNP